MATSYSVTWLYDPLFRWSCCISLLGQDSYDDYVWFFLSQFRLCERELSFFFIIFTESRVPWMFYKTARSLNTEGWGFLGKSYKRCFCISGKIIMGFFVVACLFFCILQYCFCMITIKSYLFEKQKKYWRIEILNQIYIYKKNMVFRIYYRYVITVMLLQHFLIKKKREKVIVYKGKH